MNRVQTQILTSARRSANDSRMHGSRVSNDWDKAYHLGMANVAGIYIDLHDPIATQAVSNEIRFLFGGYQQ